MASSENLATPPAEKIAEPIANASITETSEQSQPVPTTTPAAQPKERLAESSLETSHAELPPLSTIPAGNEVAEEVPGPSEPAGIRSTSRRGLGRSGAGKAGAGSAARPAIGVVEDTNAISESLSGQYVQGYGEQQPRQSKRVGGEPISQPAQEEPASKTDSASDTSAPREFVPPVSKGTYKAEMNPDRERQAREDKRRERQNDRSVGDNRGPAERPARGERQESFGERRERQADRNVGGNRGPIERPARGERQEFFGERRESQKQDWSPGGRPESREPKESKDSRPHKDGARQKLVIEPAKIPVQAEETFFSKIKRFFGSLFGISEPEIKKEPSKGNGQRGRNYSDRDGQRGGRDRYRDRQHGNFRHGNRNRSGNPQSYNRDGRHRPHSRGGNKPNRGE
ncbi:MAG: hypothetical protein LBV12_09880 [Puniceicoccales bacterium]|nr:hypothetical protein [Puniceicoccales bacterium]